MSCGKAMLAFISVPFATLLLSQLFMSQTYSFQIHVNAIMGDADFVLLPDHVLKHSSPESVAFVRFFDDLCFMHNIWLSGSADVLIKNQLTPCFFEVLPYLLNPSARDLHCQGDLLCSHPLLFLTNDPMYLLPSQLHIP